MTKKQPPMQRKMFMTPQEIMHDYQPNPDDRESRFDRKGDEFVRRPEKPDELYARKLDESYDRDGGQVRWTKEVGSDGPRRRVTLGEYMEGNGMPGSIHLADTKGYRTLDPAPNKPVVAGGHHRLAVAAHLNDQQFLPVVHHPSVPAAMFNSSGIDDPTVRYT